MTDSKFYSVKDLITELRKCQADKPINLVFHREMSSDFEVGSWRGSYDMPAIIMDHTMEPITVGAAIEKLSKTSGKKVVGYKGGDYILRETDTLFVVTDESDAADRAIYKIEEYNECVSLYLSTGAY